MLSTEKSASSKTGEVVDFSSFNYNFYFFKTSFNLFPFAFIRPKFCLIAFFQFPDTPNITSKTLFLTEAFFHTESHVEAKCSNAFMTSSLIQERATHC